VREFPLHKHFTGFAVRRRQEVMENLSPESRALYEMLHAESREEYETCFVTYKKEMADTLKVFIDESAGQIKKFLLSVDMAQQALREDIVSIHANLSHELDTVKCSLSADIATLFAVVDHALHVPTAPANPSSIEF
jgi:hypothetical protein